MAQLYGGNLIAPQSLYGGSLVGTSQLSGGFVTQAEWSFQRYEGSYEITPSSETQTLPTEDRVAVENIVIKPIPQNYGLITWNGSTITVS